LSLGSGLRRSKGLAPATTPSADSRRSLRTLRSVRNHCWQTVGPPGIRLSASPQATPNLPPQPPHEFRASESIAPLPGWPRPSIRFWSIVSVVLPPASFPRMFTPQLPLARSSARSAYRGTSTPQALGHVRRTKRRATRHRTAPQKPTTKTTSIHTSLTT
jgi:hypothetical protein